tara:strand:+ start:247 stop:513 length:267 start_codon:yes stop_codon:yes gene_type:complete
MTILLILIEVVLLVVQAEAVEVMMVLAVLAVQETLQVHLQVKEILEVLVKQVLHLQVVAVAVHQPLVPMVRQVVMVETEVRQQSQVLQ